MEEFRQIIAGNITFFRKRNNWTQAELADKLNYSDKAISKWERGESIPDVFVLKQIADLFGITVDILTKDTSIEELSTIAKPVKKLTIFQRILIVACSFSLVWLVATIAYVFPTMFNIIWDRHWLVFIYAIPISFIVLLVFSCVWGNTISRFCMTTGLIWTTIVSFHISFSSVLNNVWLVYTIGVPLEILAMLWFGMKGIKIFANRTKNKMILAKQKREDKNDKNK